MKQKMYLVMLPEMINARATQIAEHIRSRFSIALPHQISAQFAGVPQSLLCAVTVQSSVIPLAFRRRNDGWPVAHKCICHPKKNTHNKDK